MESADWVCDIARYMGYVSYSETDQISMNSHAKQRISDDTVQKAMATDTVAALIEDWLASTYPITQQSVNKSTTIQLSATANGLNLHEARWTDIGSPDAGDDSADGD